MSNRRLIYFLLCCGCVTISFNVAAIAAAIPAISIDLQLSDLLVSKIIPFYMIPYGIGALLYAPLTRYFSYKRILGTTFIVFALSCFYCAQAASISQFFTGRMAMGISGASAIPLGLVIIGQLFEKHVRGRLVGLFFGCSFAASIVGILVGGLWHWRWLFYIPAAIGFLTGLGVTILNTEDLNKVRGVKVSYWACFQEKKIREVFFYIFIISFLYHGVHKWFGVYLDRIYHLDKLMIGFFFLLMSISGALGQIGGGFISDKKGRYTACIIGLIVLSIATMLLYGQYPLFILAFVLCMVSMGWAIGHNGISTILTDFPDERRPEIAGLNSSVRFISGGIGFSISSLFVGKSFGVTFLVIGILMLLSVGVINKVVPKKS